MTLFMALIVVLLVHMVPPFLGSLLTPMFAFWEETAQREAQQGQADGQDEKAFHVGLLVGLVTREPSHCCSTGLGTFRGGSAGSDPINKLLLNQYFKHAKETCDRPSQSQWSYALFNLNEWLQ